jgi:hypothetical protein
MSRLRVLVLGYLERFGTKLSSYGYIRLMRQCGQRPVLTLFVIQRVPARTRKNFQITHVGRVARVG